MSDEGGDSVRITAREVYNEVRELSGDVRRVLETMPLNEAAHSKAHEGYEKRLENHGDRIRDLESSTSAHGSLPQTVATLAVEVSNIAAQQNRSAWLPALLAGLAPTVLGAIVVANLLPKA